MIGQEGKRQPASASDGAPTACRQCLARAQQQSGGSGGGIPRRASQTGESELNLVDLGRCCCSSSSNYQQQQRDDANNNSDEAISCHASNRQQQQRDSTPTTITADAIDDKGIRIGAQQAKKRLLTEQEPGRAAEMRSSPIESPLQFAESSSSWSLSNSPIGALVAPPAARHQPTPPAAPIVAQRPRSDSNNLIQGDGSGGQLLACKRVASSTDRDLNYHKPTKVDHNKEVSAREVSNLESSSSSVAKRDLALKYEKRHQHRELEVEWMRRKRGGLFKNSDFLSGDQRSQFSFRTRLVNSIKGRRSLQNGHVIGRTIKSFVDNFRSNFAGESNKTGSNLREEDQLSDQANLTEQQKQPREQEFSDGSDESRTSLINSKSVAEFSHNRLVNSDKNAINKKRKTSDEGPKSHQPSMIRMTDDATANQFRASASTQLILNRSAPTSGRQESEHKLIRTSSRSDSLAESTIERMKTSKLGSNLEGDGSTNNSSDESNHLNQIVETTSSNNNLNNTITSGGCLAKNKHIIDDKLRKQRQQPSRGSEIGGQARFDERRSTYCSSVGAVTTTDMNFDSSFSSANNCSDSNVTCNAMNRLCSREFHDKPENSSSYECRLNPSHNNQKQLENEPDPSQGEQPAPLAIKSSSSSSSDQRTITPNSDNFMKRDNWDKNIEFLLAVIGFAVDLGNVWRFPYICYKNGGGAFLIPYTIMFILGGLPIFYLEMSLGQYFSSGCLTVWRRVCPLAKGIGYAMCVLNFYTGLYYNTIISWAVFFFVESFTSNLPWTTCNNHWNSKDCRTIDQRQVALKSNYTSYATSLAGELSGELIGGQSNSYSSPTKDYFEREVLQFHLSTGIDDLGNIRTPLAFYLAIVFICIYFAIWKGVKSTGKVVWITALLPYFVLIPLLVRGIFLEGAWLGIKYYLNPQWMKIIDVDVWVEAAKQIYFSLGPGFGTLMALSSYNKFNHNCRRDTLIAAAVNYFASFISGFVIFAVLGYMATIQNVSISEVATEGPGLVFQVYPEGLATMRFSSMWSILFFIMVITLGIDSTFGGLESVITGLCDEYPRVLRAHRGIFIGVLIIVIYLCSLPTTTNGGHYVITILESYGTSLSLLFIVLIETIIVCWLYGTDKFCKNLEEMYGEMPGPFWRICWKYISPTILLLIFSAACLQELDKYHTLTNGRYTYPDWAPTIGLLMTGSSVCCIPIYAIYYLKTQVSGSFMQRLKIASRPIEGEQRRKKEIYLDAVADKIRDENDIHLNTVI